MLFFDLNKREKTYVFNSGGFNGFFMEWKKKTKQNQKNYSFMQTEILFLRFFFSSLRDFKQIIKN